MKALLLQVFHCEKTSTSPPPLHPPAHINKVTTAIQLHVITEEEANYPPLLTHRLMVQISRNNYIRIRDESRSSHPPSPPGAAGSRSCCKVKSVFMSLRWFLNSWSTRLDPTGQTRNLRRPGCPRGTWFLTLSLGLRKWKRHWEWNRKRSYFLINLIKSRDNRVCVCVCAHQSPFLPHGCTRWLPDLTVWTPLFANRLYPHTHTHTFTFSSITSCWCFSSWWFLSMSLCSCVDLHVSTFESGSDLYLWC